MANLQANSILERINQLITNFVRTYDLQHNYLDKDEPWSETLSSTAFAVQSRYHTTLQATPDHLVFGNENILNTPFITYWENIRLCKQKKF